MAALLYRLAGQPDFTPPVVSPFSDVTPRHAYYREICWCVQQKIFRPRGGIFRPRRITQRDQAVAFVHRLAGSPTVEAFAPFSDVSSRNPFRRSIGWARNTGLMAGKRNNTFLPTEPILRAEIAALFYRYVNGGIFGKGIQVKGSIAIRYWKQGGHWGSLGLPTGNERRAVSRISGGVGVRQDFTNGTITRAPGPRTRTITGPHLRMWKRAGGVGGSLGFPRGDRYRYGAGWRQAFEGGTRTIYEGWNPPAQFHGPVLSITPARGGVTIRRGWNGTRVRIIQRKLGVVRGGSSQTYDAGTESAVRAFQRRNRLVADGVVGAKTWAKLAPEYPFTMDAWQTRVAVAANASRTERIEAMIRFAMNARRSPYTWGGAGWKNHSVAGYDCSGLVLQSLYAAGLDPQPINVVRHAEPTYRTSQMLYADPKLKTLKLSQRRRGDLIFWGDSRGIVRHVAIYLGENRIIEANVSSYGSDTHVRPYAAQLSSSRFVRPNIKRPFV